MALVQREIRFWYSLCGLCGSVFQRNRLCVSKKTATESYDPESIRQLLMENSRMAVAPICSSCSIIAITSLRLTIARTAHQFGSSRLLTVGDVNPGVMASAVDNCSLGTLYYRRE